ncbi:MAG: ABC transporter permease [Gammaproteobacteria bacterium]|nr:ABC transporter permease [Gammaproteobacteria bacterium]MBU1553480.1 ABC transporter permease [Gammaproteobacteria bacterium]MBU2070566.1 ABC transporter permease [Gammaproteobacteria bacterium]MBU2185378.1 ABC transporter permease [Gammaproteobacteria bacterium]MBU2207072.1 ABC transporter permease [Gammaproteobacteria bacterium]
MRSADLLRFNLQLLLRHRFRSLMILLALAIGVAAVNLLTGLGEGARAYVLNQFSLLGNKTLIMLPGKKETSGGLPPLTGESPRDITLNDATAISRLPGVTAVAPLLVGIAEVRFAGRQREVVIAGTSSDYFSIRQLNVQQGQPLPAMALDTASPVAVIGSTVKRELFGNAPALGQWLKAGDRRFRIIGILSSKGQAMGMDMNDLMLIPVASAQVLFNQPGLFRLLIESNNSDSLPAVKQRVELLMQRRQNGVADITLISQDAILSAFGNILTTLNLAISGIAAISLLVAGILIMNVTLISVSQRTAEIGLLKAIGAADSDIQTLFLSEALLMALLGAIAGMLLSELGLLAMRLRFSDLAFHTPWWARLLALSIALATSLLFAWGPARRAARMSPISALQGKVN